MKAIRVDLEELVRRVKWVEKHADYLLIAQHVVVVVEETSRAKTDDVKKLEKTIDALLHGSLRDFLPIDIQPKQIVAVIHAHRGVDPMIIENTENQDEERHCLSHS